MTKKQTLLWAVKKKKKTSQLFAGTQSCILVNVPILSTMWTGTLIYELEANGQL